MKFISPFYKTEMTLDCDLAMKARKNIHWDTHKIVKENNTFDRLWNACVS